MAMVSCFAIFMMIQTLKPGNPETSWIINQFRQNFAATLAVPLPAVASFCIVTRHLPYGPAVFAIPAGLMSDIS
jgi:hypothetical protein